MHASIKKQNDSRISTVLERCGTPLMACARTIGKVLCVGILIVGSPSHAEMLSVPATSSSGVTSAVLQAGVLYKIEATGTYNWGAGEADAEWILSGVSGALLEVYPTGGFTESTDALDLLINGAAVTWRGTADGTNWSGHTFSPSHLYNVKVVGQGLPLTFSIADQTPFGPAYYSDNSGSLTVHIQAVPPVVITSITCSNDQARLTLSNCLADVTYVMERSVDLRLTNAWTVVTNLTSIGVSDSWTEAVDTKRTHTFYRVTVPMGTNE